MSAGKSAPFCVVPAKGNLKCTSHAIPFCLLTIGEGKVTVCSWKTASFSFRETTVAWAFWLGGKMGLLANKQKKREYVCQLLAGIVSLSSLGENVGQYRTPRLRLMETRKKTFFSFSIPTVILMHMTALYEILLDPFYFVVFGFRLQIYLQNTRLNRDMEARFHPESTLSVHSELIRYSYRIQIS